MKRICRATMSSLTVLPTNAQENAPVAELSPTVRTMTFNIRCGTANDGENHWEKRRDQAAAVIRRHAPDVAGLQEAFRFQLDELLERLPEYRMVGEGRDGGTKGEYSAILYRNDAFDVVDSGTFWLSETPEKPSRDWDSACVRICTWAHLRDRRTGLEFRVYNTHLDHRSQLAREKGVELIAQTIAKRQTSCPFLLMGDFNAAEDNPVVAYLKTSAPTPLVDTFRVMQPEATKVRTFHAFKGDTEGGKIDYILVPPDIATLAAEIVRDNQDGRYPSDHFPVTATLRLPAVR
ncbi:MAG: endonuclease/exonuclease/phosphatase family protein [Lentisphaeria bacterium]|jgi:endonuclease/exonuclease/phosphatase family metal-dependent hydrolase|nr:endonuclease/exonuclease/phosphatase family protein [Lentisphaeria bacterium]